MALTYLDKERIKKLIAPRIRPRLNYAAMVWLVKKKRRYDKNQKNTKTTKQDGFKPESSLYEETFKTKTLNPSGKKGKNIYIIAVYIVLKGVEKVDREDLFVWDTKDIRGHEKVKKKTIVGGMKKKSIQGHRNKKPRYRYSML